MEKMTIQFANSLMYDRLHTLAVEYSATPDFLITLDGGVGVGFKAHLGFGVAVRELHQAGFAHVRTFLLLD